METRAEKIANSITIALSCITLIIGSLIIFCSCSSTKKTTSKSVVNDSIRVEIREREVFITDTVFIQIPVQNETQTVKDTISLLSNDYCISTAKILPNGYLFHNLITNDFKLPVEVQLKTVYKDSLTYKDKYVEKPVITEVEKKVSFVQKIGYLVLGALLLGLVLGILKIKKNFF